MIWKYCPKEPQPRRDFLGENQGFAARINITLKFGDHFTDELGYNNRVKRVQSPVVLGIRPGGVCRVSEIFEG